MSKRITISTILGLGLLLAFALGAQAQRESREPLREEFHQTYPLAAGGRVALHNINGSVRVQGWERNEVRLDAVKSAYKRERLEEARIEVNAAADSVDIRTRYPDRSLTYTDEEPRRYDNPATVEYTLSVPRGARLQEIELINGSLDLADLSGDIHASSINGKVTARNLAGEAKLSTINGPLEAAYAQLPADRPVSLNSVNGIVTLVLPSDVNASVKANTVHGSISNDFGLPVRRGRYVGADLAGQLGSGGPRIRLSNVNGTIHVRHASDGRPLSPATNQLPATSDDGYGPSEESVQREVEREVAREVERAHREAERAGADARREAEQARREIEEAQREGARAGREAQRDAERERVETQREAEREREEAQREAKRESLESLREAERDREEARREAERERVAMKREVERARREAERERERAQRDIERARSEIEREQGDWNYGDLRLVERETKSFPVSGVPRVRVETFDGAISVEAWDRAEVQYTATKRARDEQAMKAARVRTEQTGGGLTIAAESDRRDDSGSTVALEVRVPRNSNLVVSTGDGRVRVAGVNGELEVRTGDGAVDVTDARGRARIETGDGRVRIAGFDGEADAQTGDGRITLEGRFRRLAARTNDGGISLALPADADATIETDAESVINDGLAAPSDGGGEGQRVRRWRVGRGGATITLHTGDGSIYLRRIEGVATR
ncbi:MAG TPA: DUF4097 family beta strand repeat-containing protein [Pyrinomonadaceae bacterium]|jgi:DUF4097 and DUF4098 domain-containing protein YvlB